MRAGVLLWRWQRKQGEQFSDFEDFIVFVEQNKIDVCLFSKAPEISNSMMAKLKSRTGVRIIWWTFDYMLNPNVSGWYIPLAKLAHACYQTDGIDENKEYDRLGVNRYELHQGIDPSIHYECNEKINSFAKDVYSADVAFFGSLYTPERRELHDLLKSKYGSRYKQWGGKGFEQGLWNAEFRKAVKLSKVIIGDNFTNEVAGYWSDRVYLTLGCKGFFITHYVKGLEKVFNIGEELDTWNNKTELIEKIDFYLKAEKLRDQIAYNGYSVVQEKHTYDNRIKFILETI